MTQAQAALINKVQNIAKTHDQEAWLISYVGTSRTPQIKVDNNQKVLQVIMPNDALAPDLKYPYRVGNSVFNRIDYKTEGRNLIINFHLNNQTNNAQIVADGKAWKLVVSYNATVNIPPIVVAIDAGHGGKDPGTIGRVYKLYEKNVTLDIAKRLYNLLNSDPAFTPTLVRNRDVYISVPERSNIARKNKADLLISIHADASPNVNALGASVWVLSTTRATTETGRLLERQEQQSSLLGGTGEILSSTNQKIARDVIDLSFTQQQQTSTLLANSVLAQMQKITNLHKAKPQYASLGVLRSPDIPSILIETGFLSNRVEEGRLRTATYRANVAQAIYNGLVNFRNANLSMYIAHNEIPQVTMREDRVSSRTLATAQADSNAPTQIVGTRSYTVVKGDTLYRLADKFGVSYKQLVSVNNFKNDNIYIGQKINIPVVQSAALPEVSNSVDYNRTTTYTVKSGDSLNRIAYNNKLTLNDLLKANPNVDKDKPIYVGMKLNIPQANVVSDDDDSYESVTKMVDSGETYKVKAGENITLIAKRYDLEIADLASFNNVHPDRIRAGQTLKIPQIVVVKQKVSESNTNTNATKATSNNSATKATSNNSSSAKSSSTSTPATITYTVVRGDTLSGIAKKFNMTLSQLKQLNNLKSNTVYAGQKLKVYKK
ncbi:LysM peptidoglycan-binding domain-containing protein [Psittacicella melopsittaci]|uniref:LysM peptidoglycan-binding domain-containing protein n=1 Tax=Psittacicella melopsittaci TaxID=2028576 RepID=UPI001CA67C38|nr:LysM peptidoglycan-binding domain-containing protein [Psittacicella melopsittaci]